MGGQSESNPDGQRLVATMSHLHTEVEKELVVLDTEAGVYYGIDGVGSRIWELLQEPRTITELQEAILEEFAVGPEQCEQDLRSFIDDLQEAGLVETRDAPDS